MRGVIVDFFVNRANLCWQIDILIKLGSLLRSQALLRVAVAGDSLVGRVGLQVTCDL